MIGIKSAAAASLVALTAMGLTSTRPVFAASAGELTRDGKSALATLYRGQPSAKVLGPKAAAILVFPRMVKAGFMFGGQIGEGVLRKGGKVAGYYNSVAASYGFQAGVQKFGYALFFMTNAALDQLDSTKGFELGVGPSFVIMDEGKGKSVTSNTLTSDVYAYIFDQKGLMAGAGIQGSKITKISK